jgi:FlaA1/EpsC-like NDP-sugar epimerase
MGLSYINRLQPTVRHVLCALALVPIFAASHFAAYWLRFDGVVRGSEWQAFTTSVAWSIAVKLLVFGRFRIYQGWSRYATFHDMTSIVKATTASSVLVLLADYLFHPGTATPRSVFLMDWGLTIVIVGGLRAAARFVQESEKPSLFSLGKKPVFIVGANDSGEALLRAIRRSSKLPYRVVGFIAEDQHAVQTHIGGVPVIGTLKQTCELAKSFCVNEVLITAGELSGQHVRRLVEEGKQSDVSVKVLPSYEQLLRGNIDLRPRQVSIEDLLRRDPVQLDMQELHRWIDGRSLLVTGSAGSIGSEICRQLLQFKPQRLVLVDRSENGQFFLERELRNLPSTTEINVCMADINDRVRMKSLLRDYRPDIIFHAAAYKHVPMMESNVGEAVKNITIATRRLADLADEAGVTTFVMISTDKAVNPTSIMGACKRVAELYVQALSQDSDCRFVTVRFGNVLDSAGSVVPIFREQIARGGPVTVTHPDMRRFFMTIPEASQLVIQAGAMGRGGEIFVLDMGDPVRIVDLATDLINLSGFRVGEDIEVRFTGVRPGEKLYEELNVDGEIHLPTSHAKIVIAKGDCHPFNDIVSLIDRLESAADSQPQTIKMFLKSLVSQREHFAHRTQKRRAA